MCDNQDYLLRIYISVGGRVELEFPSTSPAYVDSSIPTAMCAHRHTGEDGPCITGRNQLKFEHGQIDGLVQERHNSSGLVMEIRFSCTNPSK